MYCIQESKMLNNWTTKLFLENFEFSLEIPDLATQIKKMLNFLRRSSGWFSKGTYRRTILNKKTSTIMRCTVHPGVSLTNMKMVKMIQKVAIPPPFNIGKVKNVSPIQVLKRAKREAALKQKGRNYFSNSYKITKQEFE